MCLRFLSVLPVCLTLSTVTGDNPITIQVADFLSGDGTIKRDIANNLNRALHGPGFFLLNYTNVVSDDVISNMYQSAQSFFSQSLDYKLQYRTGSYAEDHGTGFAPSLSVQASTLETYSFTNQGSFIFEKTLPSFESFPPELYEAEIFREYNISMTALMRHVHEIAAMGLNLSSNLFNEYMDPREGGVPAFTVRMNSYAPQECSAEAGEACLSKLDGIREHTDTLGFTLLYSNTSGGLQVRDDDGNWMNVGVSSPENRLLVVTCGDMVERWTNGHWKAVSHRVSAVDEPRLSMIFFGGPVWSQRIAPFPKCDVCNRDAFRYEQNRGQTAKEYRDERLRFYDSKTWKESETKG